MIYFDNSATTPIDRRVVDAMMPYLTREYGNPSSKYYTLARNAKNAVEDARSSVAKLLNCKGEEIIFTSGAAESNNFIIKGITDYHSGRGKHIITSKVEHKAVLEVYEYLETKGFEVTYLDVNNYGQVESATLRKALREDTILVSIIWGNNELGSLNDIKELAETCKERKVFFHTDATQVVGKVGVNLNEVPVDFLSLSAHKLYGPKGVGAVFMRNDEFGLPVGITPLIHGGKQENGLRGSTHAVHNIVALGKACEIASGEMENYIPKIIKMEEYLLTNLKDKLKDLIQVNGDPEKKIPGLLNLSIRGLNNELFIRKLQDRIALSTGSACSLGEPSYVLKAIGKTEDEIVNTLRISLSKFNTKTEIDEFLTIFG